MRKYVQFVAAATVTAIGSGTVAALGTSVFVGISQMSRPAGTDIPDEALAQSGNNIWIAFWIGVLIGTAVTAYIFFRPNKAQADPVAD
ncbi:MAG: hypothetical protein IH944_10980 [Armatimonadetes bacterium]|nr:hypothetical protein [Armatimonadota bacterium]